jgi:DNA-binding CsgD family transcriptional regulator
LGQTAYELGDCNRTKAWANQTLEFALAHGMKSIAVAALQLLGVAEEREGHLLTAYDRLSESVALARSMGTRGQWWVVMGLPALARVVGARGDLAQASRLGAETAELARGLGDLQAIARALESCAWVAADAGQYARALRLAGAATTIRDRTHAAIGASDSRLTSHLLERSRAALGRHKATTYFSNGQSLALEVALDEATSLLPSPTMATPARGTARGLTPREREVVTLVVRGMSNRQIAEALVISEATAVRHISNVLAKLGMASRAQIAVWSVSHGFGDPVAT